MTHPTPTPAEGRAHKLQHSFLMHPSTAEHHTGALLDALATAGFGTYNTATEVVLPRVVTEGMVQRWENRNLPPGNPYRGAQETLDDFIAEVEGKP